jgi:hypothetical protein
MPSNEEAAQVAGILLIVLDILTVAGRFYSRWITKLGFGWDDWTILIALLTGILPGALSMWGTFSPSFFSLRSSGRIKTSHRSCKTNIPISKQYFSDWPRRRQ